MYIYKYIYNIYYVCVYNFKSSFIIDNIKVTYG